MSFNSKRFKIVFTKKGSEVFVKVRDVFLEIRTGRYFNNTLESNEAMEVYTFKKEALSYSTLVESRLEKRTIYCSIHDKYLMKPRDIIISLKKPYKVGTITYNMKKNVLIPNNFGILRGINMDLYSYVFVSNYLERIGISKYVSEHNITGDLSLEDIKDIDLPDIPKEKQMTISELMKTINERSNIYSNILENDDKIVKYALNKVIGDDNV